MRLGHVRCSCHREDRWPRHPTHPGRQPAKLEIPEVQFMLKRLLAIVALAAVAAACNPAGTPTPTLSLSTPTPAATEMPSESPMTSP